MALLQQAGPSFGGGVLLRHSTRYAALRLQNALFFAAQVYLETRRVDIIIANGRQLKGVARRVVVLIEEDDEIAKSGGMRAVPNLTYLDALAKT